MFFRSDKRQFSATIFDSLVEICWITWQKEAWLKQKVFVQKTGEGSWKWKNMMYDKIERKGRSLQIFMRKFMFYAFISNAFNLPCIEVGAQAMQIRWVHVLELYYIYYEIGIFLPMKIESV